MIQPRKLLASLQAKGTILKDPFERPGEVC
jgi:hypothetical protein